MRVDQPRQHEPAGDVEHVHALDGDAGLDPLDRTVAHEHVRGPVETPRPATTQQQVGHLRNLKRSRHADVHHCAWPAANPAIPYGQTAITELRPRRQGRTLARAESAGLASLGT